MNATDDILAALTEDGDEVQVGRYTVRLRIEPDDIYFTDIAEMGDCYGHTAWPERQTNDYGYASRPDGFDGFARKLQLRSDQIWWQPPDDLRKAPRHDVNEVAGNVRDILEYGFTAVGIELIETVADSRGNEHRVVADRAWIGGVEPFADAAYVRTIVSDLFAELQVAA